MNILNSGRFSMGSSGAGILKKLISMHDQDNHLNFVLSVSKDRTNNFLFSDNVSIWYIY